MKNSVSLLVCLLSFALMFSSVTEAREYRILVNPRVALAPLVVADVKGFFAEEGLEVKLLNYTTAEDWFNAYLHGRVDMAVGWNTTHIFFRSLGNDDVAVGAIGYDDGFYRIVTKQQIALQDFPQQKIGTASESFGCFYTFHQLLEPENIPLSELQWLGMEQQDVYKNFVMGRLNIIWLGALADKAIEEGDGKVVGGTIPDLSLDMILIPRKVFNTIPKDDLKKMWRALMKAIEWIDHSANEEEYYTVLTEFFPKRTFDFADLNSLEDFREMRRLVKTIPKQEMYRYNSEFLEAAYKTTKDTLADMGQYHEFVYREIVDSSALLEVLEEMGLAAAEKEEQ